MTAAGLLVLAALTGWAGGPGPAEAAPVPGPQVLVSGDWSLVVEELPAPWPTGLPARDPEWVSPVPVARVTIRRAGGRSPGWQVLVRRDDARWPPGGVLQACLTDTGWGGTVESPYLCAQRSYLTVGPQDALFFWGSGNPTDIGVSLRLLGLSVDVAPGIYTAQVVYTIVPGAP